MVNQVLRIILIILLAIVQLAPLVITEEISGNDDILIKETNYDNDTKLKASNSAWNNRKLQLQLQQNNYYYEEKHPISEYKEPTVKEKKNVILIIADDMGIELLNLYASEMKGEGQSTYPKTPNIDKLANNGLTFTRAYSYPICSATRAAMLTGRFGYRTNIRYQIGVKCRQGIKYPQPTIPNSLNDNIKSACIGKWHIGTIGKFDSVKESGFGHYEGLLEGALRDPYKWNMTGNDGSVVQNNVYITEAITNAAIDWLEKNQHDQFFLWLAHYAPHFPFHLPPLHMHNFGYLKPEDIDTSDPEKLLQYAYAMIESLDYEIGRLLEKIDEDVLKRTTIIFLGDNGTDRQLSNGKPYTLEKSKLTIYEGGIHIPMIISGAGVEKTGEFTDTLVHTVDVFSTVLDIMGGHKNTEQEIDSVSLYPLTKYENYKLKRNYVISELQGPDGMSCDNIDSNPPIILNYGKTIINQKFYKILVPLEFKDGKYNEKNMEFYDLLKDPFEKNNLIGKKDIVLSLAEYNNYMELEDLMKNISI